MKVPILLATFGFTYHLATLLPVKLFNKFGKNAPGIDQENQLGAVDIVGRFRVFDKVAEAEAADGEMTTTEQEILNYLSIHSNNPLSKPELVNHMITKMGRGDNLFDKVQVKRSGKDENDIYYSFGKVHGLENIAFVDKEDLKETQGNPVKLQKLVN